MNDIDKVQFLAALVIRVMDDDPTKIVEAQDDAKMMFDAGADFGNSRASLMAEYAVITFCAQNKGNDAIPEIQDMSDDDENAAMNIVQEHIEKAGW